LSPWANEGASAKTLGIGGFVWVIFMQLAAAALGGYIAGRLRAKWVSLHTEEVAFRDTAHGFLAWGVATLFTAALLTSSVTSIISGGILRRRQRDPGRRRQRRPDGLLRRFAVPQPEGREEQRVARAVRRGSHAHLHQ